MRQPRRQSVLALTMAFVLLCTTTLVQAAQYTDGTKTVDEPSVEAMVADGLLMRPVGVLATLLGSVIFVATLPFTLPTKSVSKAAQKMVVEPAQFTFTRPFGHIESAKPSQ